MERPMLFENLRVASDIDAIRAFMPVPGFGVLAVNSFLVRADQPVLIDTGLPLLRDDFLASLAERIDPADLRWIFVTHCDTDHIGALSAVLEAAPNARIATNYIGMGKLMMHGCFAPERFFLVNPGQTLDVGDRQLAVLRPPCYDAPETMALFDPKCAALFSSDCFGALLPEPADDIAEIAEGVLRDGVVTWATVDAPWLANVDGAAFGADLANLKSLSPEIVLSAHLPVARGGMGTLGDHLHAARGAAPFVGPDQSALMAAAE